MTCPMCTNPFDPQQAEVALAVLADGKEVEVSICPRCAEVLADVDYLPAGRLT